MLKIKKLLKIILNKKINILIFFILLSFLFGNIFGLNSKNLFVDFAGTLFFLLPLTFELVNWLSFFLKKTNTNKYLYTSLISIRRGFFLGICIEAFKVGS